MPCTSDVVEEVCSCEVGECAEMFDGAERSDGAGIFIGVGREM